MQDEIDVDSVGPEWRHVRHTVETVGTGATLIILCGALSLVHFRFIAVVAAKNNDGCMYDPIILRLTSTSFVFLVCYVRSIVRAGYQ